MGCIISKKDMSNGPIPLDKLCVSMFDSNPNSNPNPIKFTSCLLNRNTCVKPFAIRPSNNGNVKIFI